MEGHSEGEAPEKEFLWVQLSETAFLEFIRNRFVAAATQWENAYHVAQGFDDRDPRVASSLSNFAISRRIKEDFVEAEQLYQLAIERWKASSTWVEMMSLSQRARSSLFHFRLERKHRKQYDQIARKKYQKLLPAGHAGTLNNLGELYHTMSRSQCAKKLYNQALQKRLTSMGEEEWGVKTIRRNIASLTDLVTPQAERTVSSSKESRVDESFYSQALRQGWIVDDPPEFTDEGRLMAAILLTGILDHSRLCRTDG